MNASEVTDNQEGDERPWEVPGACRRDCEPHRAGLLLALARTSDWCFVLGTILVFPALIGVALGLYVWWMARTDVRKMSLGLMDVAGLGRTKSARALAIIGMVSSIILLVAYGIFAISIIKGPG